MYFLVIGTAKKKEKGTRVVARWLSVIEWGTEWLPPPLGNFMGSDCYLFSFLKIAFSFPWNALEGTMRCSVRFNFKKRLKKCNVKTRKNTANLDHITASSHFQFQVWAQYGPGVNSQGLPYPLNSNGEKITKQRIYVSLSPL